MKNTKKTILIIDDDDTFLKVMSDWFSNKGFEVVGVDGGQKAFDLLETEEIDIILSDVVMKPLNGLDVLAKIKGDEKTKNIPVFMLSQMGEEEYIHLAEDLGAEDYLIKSKFSLKELTEKIQNVLSKK